LPSSSRAMSSRVKRNGEVITVATRLFRDQGSGVFVQRQLASDGRHHAEESRPAEGRLKLWVGTCRKSRRSRSSSTRARRTMRDVPRRQASGPGALQSMTLNLGDYVVRRRIRPTCTWVHSLPRAVRIPRLFNASAMAFRLLAPAFWISRTSGSRFAAN
jgi:hypothetical protein